MERTTEERLLPPVGPKSELEYKAARLQQFLIDESIDALLITRHENIAWLTGGLVDVRVGVPRETGVAGLLVTRRGQSYYVTTNNEVDRLAHEEFSSLEYEPVVQPWYVADIPGAVRKLVPGGRITSDNPGSGFPEISMKPLRLALTQEEIVRYRWLGRATAEAATEVLDAIRPGIKETAMQAMVAENLLARGILPSVFLTAVDDRIRSYRHAVPRTGVLKKLGMLNFCARRWGLCISITRFVCFGDMSQEMEDKFGAVAQVYARLLHATRAGASATELFWTAQHAYAEQGYPGEEQMHHQGGATGYWEREWIARPGGEERILLTQAMAWNPSLQGAKIEDTVIVNNGKLETLTRTPELPVIATSFNGTGFPMAGVLCK